MDTIKILFLTSLLDKMGGAEKNLYDIATHIDRSRFEPYVMCLNGGELIRDLESRGIRAEILGLDKIASFSGLKKGLWLFRFIRKERINIVVTYHHDADFWGGAIALLAGAQVISSRRDLGFQLSRLHVMLYRVLDRYYTRILCVSDAVKKVIAQREYADPDRMITVYNCLDASRYHTASLRKGAVELRKQLSIPPGCTTIGCLGSFRPIKGYIHLVRAFAKVVEADDNVRLLMVGHKDSEYYQDVYKEAERLGLAGHIMFVGHQSDTLTYLSAFDIFALPSLSEGFSNALIEAMAAGKPVVATNVGGNGEVVKDGESGLLVPPGDEDALSDAVIRLVADTELQKRLGRRARKIVTSKHDIGTMMHRLHGLYEMLYTEKLDKNEERRQHARASIRHRAKLMLSGMLYHSGATKFIEKVRGPEPLVLAYHSINRVTLKQLEIEQDPTNFKRQMHYLKDNFNVLSLDQFLECKNSSKKLPERSVLLTFDDGYRDNYLNAYPVLKELSLPATIFITTSIIDSPEPLFFDAIRFALFGTDFNMLDLRGFGLKKYIIDRKNTFTMTATIREITVRSMQLDETQKRELKTEIFRQLGISGDELEEQRLYLSWEEIREMISGGITFGSHTVTHPNLAMLSREECSDELATSRKIIKKRTGRPARALAYPFGSDRDYNAMVESVAAEVGYDCAFSLASISHCNISSFTIGRKLVTSTMSSNMSGKFSRALFNTCMLSIWKGSWYAF